MSRPKLEVVIPIFNEAENLPLLTEKLLQVEHTLTNEVSVAFLFINDGSSDGSRDYLDRLCTLKTNVRVVHLIHNFGHSAALQCGLDHCRGDITVFMDADLQDDPNAIVAMWHKWKTGATTVVAERVDRKESSRVLFNLFYFLLRRVSKKLPPINFGTYCLLDHSVIERMRQLKETNRYFPGLVAYSSAKLESIPLVRENRKFGASRVGFMGLINLALTAFLSFSSTPVKMVSVLGLLSSLAALVMGSTIISVKIFTSWAIPGWASTMTAIAFGSGIQLLCLGIIGEYVARIYDEVKQRPLYLIEKTVESSSLSLANPTPLWS